MSSTNHFCKVCSVWVNGNIGNITRHELSDFHKGNVQKQIKLANEKSKMDKVESSRVSKELDAINHAVRDSTTLDCSSTGTNATSATPPGWVSLTDPKSGKVYLFNKSTGETRWLADTAIKEPQTTTTNPKSQSPSSFPLRSDVSPTVPPVQKTTPVVPAPRPVTSVPPPRPVSTAPPPRPTTGVPPPRPQTAKQGPPPRPQGNSVQPPKSVEILKTVMMSEEEASHHDPSKKGASSTGFGDWEEVPPMESVVAEITEDERHLEGIVLFEKAENDSTNFRLVKREAPGDGDDEPLFTTRQIKKSSRRRRSADD